MKPLTSPLLGILLVLTGCATGRDIDRYTYSRPTTGGIAGVSIVPLPVNIADVAGTFRLRKDTKILVEAGSDELFEIGEYLAGIMRPSTGYDFEVLEVKQAPELKSGIVLTTEGADADLGEEGYELEVSRESVIIRAPAPNGIFYGVQTLRQLLPPQIESERVIRPSGGWKVPALSITDRPRLPWRGMLLDCCRHFMSKEFVKRYIDLLAYHKMNRFHWHLTEDQGWRIEIRKYPRLTEVGAWRGEGADRHGGFYTQEDIREIVDYARQRYVMVIPEIEMPGHSQAALAAYPELSCTGGPFEVSTRWGVHRDVYCAGKESTFEFIQDVLSEVIELFPAPYIHLGADECPKERWKECVVCQLRIQEEGLADEFELQRYFIRRVTDFLKRKQKKVIGWDEVMEGGLSEGITVQYWRARDTGYGDRADRIAVREGHDLISSPTSHCYFDYAYETISLEKVYSFDPVPPDLSEGESARVLGGEGNMWTEHVPQERVDSMVFPRIVALSEVLWSPPERREYEEFFDRLGSHYLRLVELGVDAMMPAPSVNASWQPAGKVSGLKVSMEPGLPGATIRYTLDSSEPHPDSEPYIKPIHIDSSRVVKARSYLPGVSQGLVATSTFTISTFEPLSGEDLRNGLNYSYYEGDFRRISDFAGVFPFREGTTGSLNLEVAGREDGFAITFGGYLQVEQEGLYTFFLRSDDGSDLYIGNEKVVDNDGLHGAVERSGVIVLKAGFYPLLVNFFEAGGSEALTVSYEGPDVEKQPIPAVRLFR